MLQKTQWTMTATLLAIGACFALAVRPAQAQVRYHLTRGGGKTVVATGIVKPTNTSPTTPALGIVIPPNSGITTPPTTPPAPAPTPAPVVTPPAPVVTPPTPTVTPANTVTQSGYFGGFGAPSTTPAVRSSPQGFSAGPSLLGDQRLPLGHLVDRVPPAIIGDSGPTVQKVMAHH